MTDTSRLDGAAAFSGYQWVILAVAVTAQTSAATSTQAVPVLASFYQQDLRLSSGDVGLFTASFALAMTFTSLAAGWITDRFGVRRSLFLGQMVVGAMIAGLSTVPSLAFAVPLALAAGAGSSMVNPAVAKSILFWFPLRRRATAMGIKQTGIPLAGTLGATLLPPLALAFNWRYAVAALGLAVVASALVSLALYRDSPAVRQAAGVGRRRGLGLAGLKVVLLNGNNWVVCGLATVLVGAQFCVVTYLILYLKDTQHLSATVAGGYLALVQMSGLAARVVLGFLSDFGLGGKRKLVLVSCGFLAAGVLVLVAWMAGSGSPVLLVALMIALGVSVIGWHGIWITMMSESSRVELAGLSVGFGSMVVHIGAALLPPVFGLIVDQSGSYYLAWYVLAALVLSGTLLLLWRGKERRNDE